MSDYADTGTSREGDPYAEIAALKQRVAELERERDDWRDRSFAADQREMRTRKCFPEGAELSDLRSRIATLSKELGAARKVMKSIAKPITSPDRAHQARAYLATTAKEQRDEEAE